MCRCDGLVFGLGRSGHGVRVTMSERAIERAISEIRSDGRCSDKRYDVLYNKPRQPK